ncbi:protocadherin gamma-C5-like isoform X3 [Anguilla rostrata]|uniref:protocadherin gamma-C5-like isoform X3 n=1 Tax=Anguilla rostrata TaxID=7938 RepID=UPI0030D03F8B
MECRKRRRAPEWLAAWLSFSFAGFTIAAAELTYSVSEELKTGAVVGNIAKDLRLDVQRIIDRNLRVVSDSSAQYFEVNSASGSLVIKQTIDRERFCGLSLTCTINLQIMLQNPLEMHRIVVDIVDVNDNAPQFPNKNVSLEISEAAAPGTRFRLESAQDPDVGINSLRTYLLSPNDYFVLNVETKSDGSKFPELVLEKALDREKQAAFSLLLTAVDGGQPEKSGTTLVLITILDVNDNAPVFDNPIIKVSILENSPPGTLVTKLNATDLDYGLNGEVSFLFSKYTPERVLQLFSVDSKTGEIRVDGQVDYEMAEVYHISVQARDRGTPAMEGSGSIIVSIIDVNDNSPELTITSLTDSVREDAESGTAIALINVRDLDSGKNGEVTVHIPPGLPFKLNSHVRDHFTLVTEGPLDREKVPQYTVLITAKDSGSPPLSSQESLTITLSDVNDNAPVFSQPSYSVDVAENNAPGSTILTVTASDPDLDRNAHLTFSILHSSVGGVSVSSYISIHPETGKISAVRSLDYEQVNAFRVEVQARDAGTPPQTSNVTVHVFVVDENDNDPALVYPSPPDDGPLQLSVPRTAGPGHLLSKIVCVDPDSGHNAWLFYSIAPEQDGLRFRIGHHTGELRTAQKFTEEEAGASYGLLVVVRDNGTPNRSTVVAVSVTVEEEAADGASDRGKTSAGRGGLTNISLYLIISLAVVSAVSVVMFVFLLVRCLRHRDPLGGCGDSCCYSKQSLRSRHAQHQRAQKNLHLQLNTDGPIKYMEVVGGPMDHHGHTYRPCYSTLSNRSDFVFIKTLNPSTPMMSNANTLSMTLSRKHLLSPVNEQKPPNTDWRFSQNQRPGTSGQHKYNTTQIRWTPYGKARAAPPPEAAVGTGPWPNPPTEAEQLQALMAAANEVSEATATLGPGTMGLSTRYSPQFTLQHVPDYRQNVYIPGSTATLTANQQQQQQQQQQPPQPALPQPPPQAEAPKAAQTPASKKKSAKKDKK